MRRRSGRPPLRRHPFRHSGGGRWRVFAVAVVAGLVTTSVVPTPVAAANPSAGGPAPTAMRTAVTAMAAARAYGVAVEDISARTEASRVFADPAGSWTMESFVTPRWVRRGDGTWVDVDTTLVRLGDGSPAPRASAADVRFSAGGAGPLVSLRHAGHTFTLSWPGSLPAPAVHGSSATYPDVVPGVDLVVRATHRGFSHVLVVKSRQAAADPVVRNPRFRVGGDVTMSGTPEGGLRVTAGSTVVASAGEAVMWDSGSGAAGRSAVSTSTAAAPAEGARQEVIPAWAGGGELALTPDSGLLDDPSARFPIYIDPDFAAGPPQGWAYATSNNTGSPTTDNDVDSGDTPGVNLRVGRDQETGKLVRSFLEFPMSAGNHDLRGKHILSARFAGRVDHSSQCGYGTPTYFYRTAGISAWPRQSWPGPQLQVAIGEFWSQANEVSCNEGNAYIELIDNALLADLQTAAWGQWNTYNIGMAAIDPSGAGESTGNRWKRYFLDDFRLSATYNSSPNRPSDPQTDGQPCARGSARTLLGTATPTLSALVTDPDPETDMTLHVDWHTLPLGGEPVFPKLGKLTQGSLAKNTSGQVTLPPLAPGTYAWRTHADDGTDWAPDYGPWCEFTIDTVAPNVPGVSSPVYKEYGDFHGSIGHTADFTFTANGSGDVTKYLYEWEDSSTTEVAAPSPGASVTIPLTPPPLPGATDPTRGGLLRLFVRSVDHVQNRSPIRTYSFNVGSASSPVGEWPLNETSGTTLYDNSGYEHHATLSGGTLATPGPRPGETAVSFDGVDDHAATDAPVVDTNNSFTVAAWVKLADATQPVQTAVSQLGVHNCAFYLQKADNTWAFSVQPLDDTKPSGLRVRSSSAPQVGAWTHLTGVYDRGKKSVQLYVNGSPAGSAAWSGRPFQAAGPLWIGQARWIDQTVDRFAGAVAGVRVWDRVLHPTEITRLATR
ncbi:LamG domain-containing protein [Actinosynnema sp. NPDC023794]